MWRREQPIKRPRLGLALSGGAARGAAHVGVLKVFEEEGVPVDFIAGTSAGALVGGAYAAGVPVAELAEFGNLLRWRDLGRLTLSRLGVQSNARLEALVRARLPVTRFEELRTPFVAVATDLHTGNAVHLRDRGDLAVAIRASCTLPGWYVPVTDEEGRQLVDGGLVANIPSAAVRALGADVVVAVDVNADGAKFMGPPTSLFGVLFQSLLLMQRTAAVHQRQMADLVISPRVGHIRWDEMTRADELRAAGEEAARTAVPDIKELLEPRREETPRWSRLRRRRDEQSA